MTPHVLHNDRFTPRQTGRWHGLAFLGAAVGIYLAARAVVASAAFATGGDLLAFAIAADLVLVLPGLYYLLLVRGGGLPALTVLPVFLLGLVLASTVVPPGHGVRELLHLLALPVELLLIGVLVYRARALVRAYRQEGGDAPRFEEAFPRAAREALGSLRVVDLFASEVIVLYFALAAWRRRPAVPEGAVAYTAHRDRAWGGIAFALGMVLVVEIVVVHILVSLWSATLAWVLTALGIYSLLWLVGDFRALVLRPSLLTHDTLRLRIGMRWAADVPLSQVQSIRAYTPADSNRPIPRLTVVGEPRHVLELAAPVEVRGLFGTRRTAQELAVALDGRDFATDLEQRLAAHLNGVLLRGQTDRA